jgi:hypothetical protein
MDVGSPVTLTRYGNLAVDEMSGFSQNASSFEGSAFSGAGGRRA